jgi:predicted nucleic acid-binding protein
VILVDSDVLIANLRGVDAARAWLVQARTTSGVLATSAVTIAEITGAMRSPERRDVNRLLNSVRVLPVTETIAYRAGEFRRRYRRSHSNVGIVDFLVAATADLHGLPLATLNVKHFPMFNGLRPPFELS